VSKFFVTFEKRALGKDSFHGKLKSLALPRGEGSTPRNVEWACAAHLPNPLPYFQPKSAFLCYPVLWPGPKFYTLFMTVAVGTVALSISCEWLSLMVLLIMMKEQLLLRSTPKTRVFENDTLSKTKMAKIDDLIMTKTRLRKSKYPLGPRIPI